MVEPRGGHPSINRLALHKKWPHEIQQVLVIELVCKSVQKNKKMN